MNIKKVVNLIGFFLAGSVFVLSSGNANADAVISSTAAVQGISGASGLSGTFRNPPGGSTNFDIADTLAMLNATGPSGVFTSSSINYSGNDRSTIQSFLGADGASYVGSAGTMSDGILELKGYIDISTASSVTFGLNHDDAAQLTVGGQTLLSANCCGFNNVTAIFSTPGFYAIDIVYANTLYNGGSGGATFGFFVNNSLTPGTLVQNVTAAVPEPESLALMLLGLGLISIFVLRQNARKG